MNADPNQDPQHCTRQYKKRALIAFNWLCGTEWDAWRYYEELTILTKKNWKLEACEGLFIWTKSKRARAEFCSFGALGECAYFHFHAFPTTHIFIPRLLLLRLFSFLLLQHLF
jgi:hypothetical protein